MYVLVVLPNGVVVEVTADAKSKGQEILEKVCDHLGIRTEMDYFGLKYDRRKQEEPGASVFTELWLNLRNPVERQVHSSPVRLKLRVKFWTAPHLVIQESSRHQMYNQVRADLKNGHLLPDNPEHKRKLFSLVIAAESFDDSWSCETFYKWTSVFDLPEIWPPPETDCKRSTAEYMVLKEVSKVERFGEEIYDVKEFKIGIGPHGTHIYSPRDLKLPYSAIINARRERRVFQLNFINQDNQEETIKVKCESNATATAIYRALTELHDFYWCDTVRQAVTSQYIRDLKGTIASLFNDSTPVGKKYVFDIRKTCREVHDSARRSLYRSPASPPPPPPSPPQPSKQFECAVCMDSIVDTVFFPCAHVVTCSACADRLDCCPVCRTDVESYKKIYLPCTL